MNIDKNITSQILVIGAAAGGFAYTAAVFGNPIGAVGGAIYGAYTGAAVVVSAKLSDKTRDGRIQYNAKLAFAGLAAFLAAWKLTTMSGVSLSLKSAIHLNITGFALAAGALASMIVTVIALRILTNFITAVVDYIRPEHVGYFPRTRTQ